MPKFSEMPARLQWLIIIAVFGGLTVAAYFLLYKGMAEQNATDKRAVNDLKALNDSLRPFVNQLADMNRQIESLKNQLEQMKKIVPDEKLADQFMHLMQDTAASAGIEVRRYTSKPPANREFYVEAPFEMELDGPFYSVVNFFDRVGKLERIINVSGLKIAALAKAGDAGARRKYAYSASETVAATCTTTTFFSRENIAQAGASAAPAKKP